MSDARINDLYPDTVQDNSRLVEVDSASWSRTMRQPVSTLLSGEVALRGAADLANNNAAGLTADGEYVPLADGANDGWGNYISASDFRSTPTLYAADLLLDAKIKEYYDKLTGVEFPTSTVIKIKSATLKALNGTPKVLLAAPGANKMIVINTAAAYLDFKTTAMNVANQDMIIYYTSTGTYSVMFSQDLLQAAADYYERGYVYAQWINTGLADDNSSISVTILAANSVPGADPDLYLYLSYYIIDWNNVLKSYL